MDNLIKRRRTKKVMVGNVPIGGGAPISVQSMTKTFTEDIAATVKQIRALEAAGCQIVRVAVPNEAAAKALKHIKKRIRIPLVADIHFNYRYALIAADAGVDKLRINPGNIGNIARIKEVVSAAQGQGIPIRIGVNSGSLEKHLLHKYGVSPKAMVESALTHVRILEDLDFKDIIISMKGTSVPMTIAAYRQLAKKVAYPFHIGITEAGIPQFGIVKSAVGLGILLSEGLGDTLRVSLTAFPVEEVRVAYQILGTLGLVQTGVEIISCPTCGRCQVDLAAITQAVARKVLNINTSLKIAIMGCEVNGPGEAREADLGLAAGKGFAVIFRKGKRLKKVRAEKAVSELLKLISEAKKR